MPAVEVAEGGVIFEGERNTRLFRIACALRRFGVTVEEILGTPLFSLRENAIAKEPALR